MNRQRSALPPVSTLFMLVMILLAFGLGRASGGITVVRAENERALQTAGSADTAATATRQAELTEISDLRTQVAKGSVCTPVATPTVTATPTPVPPVAAGAPMPYSDNWTVTVVDVSMMPTVRDAKAPGLFAKVSIIAVNNTSDDKRFPYDTFVLRDSTGRVFRTSQAANGQDISNWYARFQPSVPQGGYVYFDVATDAKGPFILESTTDPNFRVIVEEAARG